MSYHIYPTIATAPICNDYIVRVNGEEASCSTARVSAAPFNRRWPGHQRQEEQSEAISFLSLSTDEPLSFEIIPKEPFEEVKIRPRSLGIEPRVENGAIRFTLDKSAYFTVEPYSRGRALHIFADPIATYDVTPNTPDVLYFGKGEHNVGQIELCSGQTLFLDEGAVVYACVRAIDAENIKILGRGILDNSKNKETILFEASAEGNEMAVSNAERQHTIELKYCKNIEIDGITIRDSLVYNIRPTGCENLSIRNVKIIGCWRYNSDGIDMHNCQNVHIANCFLRTFDDAICVKGFDCYYKGDVEEAVRQAMYRGGKAYDRFSNVLVEGCVIWNDWGKALEIGAETRAEEIHNIIFRNCDIIHLCGPVLDCMNVDYADVHDVTFSDIRIEADETIPAPLIQKNNRETYQNPDPDYMPDTIRVEVTYHPEYSAGGNRRGKNRNFRFHRIHVYGDKAPRFYFKGYDATHKTENISISDFYFNGEPMTAPASERLTLGEFTENIAFLIDPYRELAKNTVNAKGQLPPNRCVRFEHTEGRGMRVMFVGNSITLHGILPEIGWYGERGMASSERDKDYVHLLESYILENDPEATFCICQVADWERGYQSGSETLPLYERARDFGADLIVLRMVENVPKEGYDSLAFARELDALVGYLDGESKAKIIVTTGFWHHPANDALREYARAHGVPCVELCDLGEQDAMKAIGLYTHSGVANHPGDLGMQAIAERIAKVLDLK